MNPITTLCNLLGISYELRIAAIVGAIIFSASIVLH